MSTITAIKVDPVQYKLAQLNCVLEQSRGLVLEAIESDDMLEELASRGTCKRDLQELREALGRVTQTFYNDPLIR